MKTTIDMKSESFIKTLFVGIILTINVSAMAQQPEESVKVVVHENGQEITEEIGLPLSMTYPLDSLLADWKIKNHVAPATDCNTEDVNP